LERQGEIVTNTYESKAVEFLGLAIAAGDEITLNEPSDSGYDAVANRDNLVRIAQVYATLATIPSGDKPKAVL
jgi:hypothetical protein